MNPIESKQLFDTLLPTIQIISISALSLLFLHERLECSASLRSAPLTQELRHEAEKAAKKNLTLTLTAGATMLIVNITAPPLQQYGGLYFFAITTAWTISLMAYIKTNEAKPMEDKQ